MINEAYDLPKPPLTNPQISGGARNYIKFGQNFCLPKNFNFALN
jgi:hypothetical protein